MATSTLRWVTTDGVPASPVTVTIGAKAASGTAKILGTTVSLNAVGRKAARGTALIASTATLTATASTRRVSMSSTIRWVTSDGVAAAPVSVTVVGTDHFGSASLPLSGPTVTSSGSKGGRGHGLDLTFYATMTATGTRWKDSGGYGTLALTAALGATGTAARRGYGRPVTSVIALVGVGRKAVSGTASVVLPAPVFLARGTSVGGVPDTQGTFLLSAGGGYYVQAVHGTRATFTLSGGAVMADPFECDVITGAQWYVLEYDGSFQSAKRPDRRLWRQFHYPRTQRALLLWRDGTVRETEILSEEEFFTADDVIAGGFKWYGVEGSWQVDVLNAAGYTLKPVAEVP